MLDLKDYLVKSILFISFHFGAEKGEKNEIKKGLMVIYLSYSWVCFQ